MDTISNIKEIAELIRDVGFILGIPFIISLFFKLNNRYVTILKEENAILKETQYDKALNQIKSQKELFEIEKSKLEQEIDKLQTNLREKDMRINYETENNMTKEQLLKQKMEQIKIEEIKNEQSIKERLAQVKLEEVKLDKKKRIIEDLNVIYNNLFTDLEFVADFKIIFLKGNSFSYYHYGGMNDSVYFYREFASRLAKLELATYEPYCDVIESGVSIDLTEQGIKFRELLFS
jgi:hypothetical protein